MLDFGFYNMDCMDGMKEFPDKFFDLAIVDPPYGININNNIGRRKGDKKSNYPKAYWDNATPDKSYFDELFRISKNQIIWGGNYFLLPPTKCFIVWRKPQISEDVSFAMVEYAWTSFNQTAKEWIGMSNEADRIHATQKPVALYEWILNRYAKENDIILDTHVGSASSLIACHNTNHKYVGFELDKNYYELAKTRLEQEIAQMNIFDFIKT
jgi:site-specific DNA-methyltransferase (adenine-specific)